MNNMELKRLPLPSPGVEVVVPLELLPAYLELHKMKPKEYKELEEVLIVEKTK